MRKLEYRVDKDFVYIYKVRWCGFGLYFYRDIIGFEFFGRFIGIGNWDI